MNPHDLAKSGTEHGEQVALFAWLNMASRYGFDAANDMDCYRASGMAYAEARYGRRGIRSLKLLFAIPNGGLRGKATAGKLKAEGVKPGVPDLFLPVPGGRYHGLFIELKRAGGKASDVQIEWIADLQQQGYFVGICEGWERAARIIQDYYKSIVINSLT